MPQRAREFADASDGTCDAGNDRIERRLDLRREVSLDAALANQV